MPRVSTNRNEQKSGRVLRALTVAVGLTISAITARAQVYEIVYDFSGTEGFEPHGPLMRASDGNFYGVTTNSTDAAGAAFRLGFPLGTNPVAFLADFGLHEQTYHPNEALAESSGYLFGSSDESVDGECFGAFEGFGGITYRMDFIGNLLDINCGLSTPDMSALIGVLGSLWGISGFNGRHGLYRMDTSGNSTILNSFMPNRFDSTVAGTGELLLASDGNVYGIADYFDVNVGFLFRSDSTGNVTIMHEFAQGDSPLGRLVEQGGFLWGTTRTGGDFGKGTMFRMDFNGGFATLHSFAGGAGDGANPTGGLLVANNSSFYGTTQAGGQYDGGTLYQIDSFGNVVIWHSFGDVGDGGNPGPLLAVNGALWGTTQVGGVTGAGTIFTLIPSSVSTVLRVIPTAGPIRIRPGDPVQIHGGVFPVGQVPTVKIGGLSASNVQLLDQENISAATPPDLAPGTLNEIIVVLPDGTQASLDDAWMADFLDVPQNDRRHGFVERVFRAGLMEGCGGGNFCEGGTIDRAQLVTMSLKAKHGPAWAPPACTGVFKDVPCPGPEADWVEDAVAEGIAQACGRDKFCPNTVLTRQAIPDILLKTEHGADYVPPPCAGIFKDVKCPAPSADAIEQVYNEGMVEGCATNPLKYCPTGRVARGPMAEYAAKAFRLP